MRATYGSGGGGVTGVKAGSGVTMWVDPRQAKQIMRMYDTLGKKLANKIIKRETRPFSKMITAKAQSNAPVKTGRLRKSIKTRVVKNSKKSKLKIIGTSTITGEGFFKGDTYYGGFQEFGWHVGSRSLGDDRRFVEGKHYMKKAVDELGPSSLRGAANSIAKALDDEASRLSKTGGSVS